MRGRPADDKQKPNGGMIRKHLCIPCSVALGHFRMILNWKENMKASPMSEEFHDWLDQCPVQWFRGEVTKDHVTYSFETPEEDEE